MHHDEADDSYDLEERALKARFDEARARSAAVPEIVAGRFVITKILGQGGMGEVYQAYDTQLERRVALKLVASGGRDLRSQDRLLNEARALARLNHPNVVAVFDAGHVDEFRVWVAMEFVQGETLKAWLKGGPRGWEEVLTVFIDVARGLAVAHAVQLVHRDLKPDNVMIDGDGRARVMDFGLAAIGAVAPDDDDRSLETFAEVGVQRQRLTRTGAILGTPLYMAPEQWQGQEVDPRADQFAYCVTLWEALHGETPFTGASEQELRANVCDGVIRRRRSAHVPAWLYAVLLRGLSVEPGGRFKSMKELLAAINAGEAKMRRQRRVRQALLGLTAAGALTGVGLGAHYYDRAQDIAACAASGDSITSSWGPDDRLQLRSAFLATGNSYAEVIYDKTVLWLDRWADQWSHSRTAICTQLLDGLIDDDLHERAEDCLADSRGQFSALIHELSTPEEEGVLNSATMAAARLNSPEECVDVNTLATRPNRPKGQEELIAAVRDQLSHASALRALGRFEAGLTKAQDALRDAVEIDWGPLVAEAELQVGNLAAESAALERSEAALRRAFTGGALHGSPRTAMIAAVTLLYVVGHKRALVNEGTIWGEVAEVHLAENREEGSLLFSDWLMNLAVLKGDKGAFDEALELFQRSLAIRKEKLGEQHPRVAETLSNIGATYHDKGSYPESIALLEQALAIFTAALGDEHPSVGDVLNNMGSVLMAMGDFEAAERCLERALEIYEARLRKGHPDIAQVMNNLGGASGYLGKNERALDLFERSQVMREAALGPDHPDLGQALNNLGIIYNRLGRHEEAIARFERSLAILEKSYGSEHPSLTDVLNNMAPVYFAMNRVDAARGAFERAMAISEKAHGPTSEATAMSLDGLATMSWATGDYATAKNLYEQAYEIRKKILGVDNIMTADTMNNLGIIYKILEDYQRALDFHQRALAAREKALPPGHTLIANSQFNIGNLYSKMGRHDEALAMHQLALSAWEAANGPDDLQVADTLTMIGNDYIDSNRPSEAIAPLERSIKILTEAGGSVESFTEARYALARATWGLPDRRADARKLASEALAGFQTLGEKATARSVDVQQWLRKHGK